MVTRWFYTLPNSWYLTYERKPGWICIVWMWWISRKRSKMTSYDEMFTRRSLWAKVPKKFLSEISVLDLIDCFGVGASIDLMERSGISYDTPIHCLWTMKQRRAPLELPIYPVRSDITQCDWSITDVSSFKLRPFTTLSRSRHFFLRKIWSEIRFPRLQGANI